MRAILLQLVLPACLGNLGCSIASAQWRVGIEAGADRFWGGSLETSSDHRSFRPYRPTIFGIGVERRDNKLAIGLQVHYSESSLALEGKDAVVAVDGVFQTVGFSPEAAYRLARIGGDNELRVHVGPLVEVWSIIDEEARVRLGGQAALSLDVPLGGKLNGSFLAGAAAVPSPFNEDELDDGYELRALWRRRFAVGLEYRL